MSCCAFVKGPRTKAFGALGGFLEALTVAWSRVPLRTLALAIVLPLAACSSINGITGHRTGEMAAPSTQAANPTPPQPQPGEVIGTGPARVALILPLTQASGTSAVGTSLRNAAELAYLDAGGNDITMLIKDDHSSPDGARAATEEALTDGAELIIGPLFASSVREAGKVAHQSGKPIIAFSTDASTAGPNLYLLSFLIENYVDRIIDFAASKGKKSIAALIPDNDYGHVAETEFQQAAARNNMRIMTIEHYQQKTMGEALGQIAALHDQIDSLFIPEQADAIQAMSQTMAAAGITSSKVQILGTGLWNDARVLGLPALQGAWFAAPENGGYNAFTERYRAKYHSDPARIATLAYDAVSLAAALAHTQGSQRYTQNVLTNRSGFNGADGVFRFNQDGTNERGLSVLQITNGTAVTISPAPHSFASSASAI
ncbi:MAG TPA: penicillin-binding protein activator [Methylocella sp.]|nr:penicillin-binding protein activator [Methylocella sp.]